MGTKINYFFKRVSKPLRAIEYIVSIGVLWAAAVSLFILADPDSASTATSFGDLIDRYEIVTIVIGAMAALAIFDLISLSRQDDPRSVSHRSNAMFGMTIGFAFIAVLTTLTAGGGNLLWVNEVTLAFISAILYLNLKVNYGNADR